MEQTETGPPDVEIEGHLQYRGKHNQKGSMKPVKLNTSKLRNTSHAERLVQEMDNALAQSSDDNETPCWTSFQQVVYDTTKASLGNMRRNIKTGSTQTTRFYGISWLKRTNLPKSVADQKHQIRCSSLQRCLQNTTEIYTSSKV